MSRFCFIAKNPAAKNSHSHDLCRIGTKHSIHGRLTNNMHRVNISMIPNGVLPYGVQAANARFRVAPARTIEVRHKAGRRPRIDGEHLKLCSLTFVLFYYSIAIENYSDPSPFCFLHGAPSGSATSLTSAAPAVPKYPLRQYSSASRLVVATFTKRKNLKRLALKVVRFRFRLVGTTGHSPDGESVLHGCFSSAMLPSASRRTCARRNSFTHNGMSACASPACLGRARGSRRWVFPQHSKKDGQYRPFCYAGGDNRTRTCDLLYVKQAL